MCARKLRKGDGELWIRRDVFILKRGTIKVSSRCGYIVQGLPLPEYKEAAYLLIQSRSVSFPVIRAESRDWRKIDSAIPDGNLFISIDEEWKIKITRYILPRAIVRKRIEILDLLKRRADGSRCQHSSRALIRLRLLRYSVREREREKGGREREKRRKQRIVFRALC